MNFPGFLGNEALKEQLSSLIGPTRAVQTLILEGETGCGKRTLARLIAAALCCRNGQTVPCGHCSECVKSLGNGHPDILTFTGGETPRSFKIETVRQLRADVNIMPHQADRKVYILENAHCLSEEAQNALLKTLEEPPPYAVFILTCESTGPLLPTVLSRAVVLRVNTLSEQEAIRAAAPLCPSATPDQLAQAAKAFGGNVGRMVQALSGGLLLKATQLTQELLDALASPQETVLLCAAAPLLEDKLLCRTVLSLLGNAMRDGLAGEGTLNLSPSSMLSVWEATRELLAGMNGYVYHPLLVTLLCTRLREAVGL